MEIFEVLSKSWASESPTLFVLALFIGLGIYLLNFFKPIAKGTLDLGDKFIDEVAKPMIPLARDAITAIDSHGKSLEAQTRLNQQTVGALIDRDRDVRDLFELRIKSIAERMGALEEGMQKLTAENLELRAENMQLKAELKTVKEENAKLKAELAQVKKELVNASKT